MEIEQWKLHTNMKKNYLLLALIICCAFAVRFIQLSSVPPSASLDEATTGWNAYSILLTGKDEYGYKMPILLRAYDDFRPALYTYTTIPFVKIFGLNVFAVRFPSVILSTLAIFSAYFLIKSLFENFKQKENLALISCLFFAISPWHIYMSRLGHEANAAFSFGIFAITFLILFIRKQRSAYLYFSSIFFVLSFYAYQSEKIFIPLIVFVLAFLFKKELLESKKHLALSLLLGIIILAPVLISTLSPSGLSRFGGTSAFNLDDPIFFNAAQVRLDAHIRGDWIGEVINNNRVIASRIFLENYISHFSPFWFFTNEGRADFKAPNVGLLYLFDLPLIILGIFYLFKKFDKKIIIFLFLWVLISPIASSITTGAPHAMRSYNFLPVWQIFSALGLLFFIGFIKNKMFNNLIKVIIFLIILISFAHFSNQYFNVFPKENAASFQYSMSKIVPYVLGNEKKYNKIIFSNSENLYQSYMFFLFYSKYDPVHYQKIGGTGSGGYDKSHNFDKFEFKKFDKNQNIISGNLYIGNYSDFTDNLPMRNDVKYAGIPFIEETFYNFDKPVAVVVLKNEK